MRKMTMQDMCKEIERAGFIVNRSGEPASAKEIYEYSPTGELGMIWGWYELAKVVNSIKEDQPCAHKSR